MDQSARRTWSRPELIVLVRSGPEEAVLDACKTTGAATGAVTKNSCLDNQSVSPWRCVPYECWELRPS